MTFDRWQALKREWRLRPPVNQLVASFLDYKPPSDEPQPQLTTEEMARMFQIMG